MKKLNSNFIPVSKSLANAAASGALEQLAATAGAPLGGGGVAGTISIGTTEERSNVDGSIRINSSTKNLEVYYSNVWYPVRALSAVTATGGSTSSLNGYKYHTFTSSGTFSVSLAGNAPVEYLVVGGGGGGGAGPYQGGGGGGGGWLSGEIFVSSGDSFDVVIGGGGATSGGPGAGANGSNGADSYISNPAYLATGLGGGGGAGEAGGATAQPGGSGGGSTHGSAVITGAPATQPTSPWGGYGNPGGDGHSSSGNYLGGGGGGAGEAGGDADASLPGNGGDGKEWVPGSTIYYGGGGGGKRRSGVSGTGGLGGGGGPNSAGTPGTGGGGAWGYTGGGGVVIFRYTT